MPEPEDAEDGADVVWDGEGGGDDEDGGGDDGDGEDEDDGDGDAEEEGDGDAEADGDGDLLGAADLLGAGAGWMAPSSVSRLLALGRLSGCLARQLPTGPRN